MLLFCWDSACVNGSSPSLNSKPKLGFDEMLGCWTKHTIYRFWRGEIRWGLPNKNVAIPLFQILPFPLQYSGKLPVCFKACCNQHSCYGTRHTAEACAWLTQYFRLELRIFLCVCFPLSVWSLAFECPTTSQRQYVRGPQPPCIHPCVFIAQCDFH